MPMVSRKNGKDTQTIKQEPRTVTPMPCWPKGIAMPLANRLEQRLVAAVGNPKPGDYNYLADVLEIVANLFDENGEVELERQMILFAAEQFRHKGKA